MNGQMQGLKEAPGPELGVREDFVQPKVLLLVLGLDAQKAIQMGRRGGQPTVRKTFVPSFIHTAKIHGVSVALPTGTVLSTRDTAGNKASALEEWPVIPVAEGAQ